MTLAEALAVISTVDFTQAKPKQFEGIADFLEGAIAELADRERRVCERERVVSEREGAASLREHNIDGRESALATCERIKPRLSFWRTRTPELSPPAR